MAIAPFIATLYLYQLFCLVNTLYLKQYEKSMVPAQARAARALLKLSVREVAKLAKVTPNTVSRIEQDESGPRGPQPSTIEAIKKVYEKAGVIFISGDGGGPGARLAE